MRLNDLDMFVIFICCSLVHVGGIILILIALIKSKKLKIIQSTPRSLINEVSLGKKVEIHGKVYGNKDLLITSPLTNELCVNYVWAIDEIHKSKFSKRKPVIFQEFIFSHSAFFFITDESQEIAAVDLNSTNFQVKNSHCFYRFLSHNLSKMPEKVKDLLLAKDIIKETKKSFFENIEYEIREIIFRPEAEVYVLGTAQNLPQNRAEIKCHPQQDGENNEIDSTKPVRSNFEKELKEGATIDYLSRSKFIISKSDHEDSLLVEGEVFVSFQSEEKMIKNFKFWINLGFYGGPVMMILSLVPLPPRGIILIGIYFWSLILCGGAIMLILKLLSKHRSPS